MIYSGNRHDHCPASYESDQLKEINMSEASHNNLPPLADRMRPKLLEEVVGQDALTKPGKLLNQAMNRDQFPSMIFWGPPGCGKTTLAKVIANHTQHYFVALSAVLSGIKDVKQVVAEAKNRENRDQRGTILFVDEIHRFNKSQQDAFLPFVEDGTIVLLGATTENPSFELNSALLSRCRILIVKPLSDLDIKQLLQRAVADVEQGFGQLTLNISEELYDAIAAQSSGDGRHALNLLETLVPMFQQKADQGQVLDQQDLEACIQQRAALYDKSGEGHYNLISAFHKSLRGSDVDASLYWLARMLAGGENGLYIARRMVRFASEDIGNADPQALAITLQAKDAYHFLGSPEGELALAQATIYLATAPKSNSVYTAFKAVQKSASKSNALTPPLHICNAPTKLMKDLGYGKNYQYAHDYEGGYVAQTYLPDALKEKQFYQPVERGYEREIKKRMDYWLRLKQQG